MHACRRSEEGATLRLCFVSPTMDTVADSIITRSPLKICRKGLTIDQLNEVWAQLGILPSHIKNGCLMYVSNQFPDAKAAVTGKSLALQESLVGVG